MAKLTYTMMVSLDGYINDPAGDFNWGQIDAEVHAHANAEAARIGTEIYGRRMYEMMSVWETLDGGNDCEEEFARNWRSQEKVVVSKSLDAVSSTRTRLVSELSPDELRQMKAAARKDLSVAGPTLASTYLNAGLVDEVAIYYIPVVVGGGTPMFQNLEDKLRLTLLETRKFTNGVVFVRYRLQ